MGNKFFFTAACTVINNCERIHCTSGSDQQCRRCRYDRGHNIKAYRLMDQHPYTNRICERKYIEKSYTETINPIENDVTLVDIERHYI